MNSHVFVIQDSPGKNILPAQIYGKLRVMLTGKEDVETAKRKLTTCLEQITSDDCLLLIGNPLFIGMAMHIALLLLNGTVCVLIWDSRNYEYEKKEITI